MKSTFQVLVNCLDPNKTENFQSLKNREIIPGKRVPDSKQTNKHLAFLRETTEKEVDKKKKRLNGFIKFSMFEN